ncbi:hypothetical protein WME73_43445 [Sorangium sp. So ce302]|uniref:hypothetical protein n=1 Tax=Sorangium sp. So ce302 TaxID=3133297 RepID=UPI003F61167B
MKARRIYFVFETPEPHAGARERRARREGRWTMGPLHGAIVSSCGHRYGDFSFNDDDGSRDTLALDSVTLGELSQNDRHESSMSPSFAVRWFEVDPAYQIARLEPAPAPAEAVHSRLWPLMPPKRRIVKSPASTRSASISSTFVVPRRVLWYMMTLAQRSWTLAQRSR